MELRLGAGRAQGTIMQEQSADDQVSGGVIDKV